MQQHVPWSDEDIEIVKLGWADGKSASVISKDLDFRHSRNSVIGKVHRLGLPMRKTTRNIYGSEIVSRIERAARKRLPRTPKRTVTKAAIVNRIRLRPAAGDLPMRLVEETLIVPAIQVEDMNIPIGQRKTLLELTNETCRWPIGEPSEDGFFFCGLASDLANNRPYCACHAARAFEPARRRTAYYVSRRMAA